MRGLLRLLVGIVTVFSLLFIGGCQKKEESKSETKIDTAPTKEMLIYCGITMVKPITEIAKIMEKKHNVKISITQGGSKDLYDSLKSSQKGDLYFPGSTAFRDNNLKDGILQDAVLVGYNRAALVVKKGNPKNIKADLNELTNKELAVVLCNPESGSIGSETKKLLTKFGNYEQALEKSVFLTTDSRNLTQSIKDGKADLVLNWYATTYWDDNKEYVEPLILDEKIAQKDKLILILTKFSKYPDIAKDIMNFASSNEGRAIFQKYGFINDEDMKIIDKDTF